MNHVHKQVCLRRCRNDFSRDCVGNSNSNLVKQEEIEKEGGEEL